MWMPMMTAPLLEADVGALTETDMSGAGSSQSTPAVLVTDPAVAAIVLCPVAVEVKVNRATPAVVATVPDAGDSVPVPEAVKVTAVPSATAIPVSSATVAVTVAVSPAPAPLVGSTASARRAGGPAAQWTERGCAVAEPAEPEM